MREPFAAGLIAAGRLLLGGVLAAIALARPVPARAVPAPGPERLAALQAACDSAWRVRIVSLRASYLLERPALGLQGVNVAPRSSGPPALITIGDVPADAKWVPWAEIERLDAGRSRAGRGALTGLLFGGAVGGILVAVSGPDLTDANDNVVAIFAVALTVGCGIAGYLLGLANPGLTPLYP